MGTWVWLKIDSPTHWEASAILRNLGEACVVVRNLREDKANLPEKKTGTANGNGNEDGKRYSSIAALSRPCTGYTATLQSQRFSNVIVRVHMLAS